MTIHLLVEGPSERALFEQWVPRLLKDQAFRVYPHQGQGTLSTDPAALPDQRRRGLLDQLPAKLRAFAGYLDPAKDGVVVLVDADDDDPEQLAASIAQAAQTHAPGLRVAVRLAVEETEAFYLGDLKAVARAFPGADLDAARDYEPDSICGTWELFGRVVNDGGGNKVAWAETMAPVLTTRPGKTRSPSFRALITGLLDLVPVPPPPKKQRPYRHPRRKPTDSGGRR